MDRRADLTSSEETKNTDQLLDWAIAASSKAYLDVAYSFKDNGEEYSEGRKEKPGMSPR